MSSQDRPSESQVINMSKRCGITLSPEQVAKYVSERERMDELPFPYDQDIFERVLTTEQKEVFLEKRLNQSLHPKSSRSQSPIRLLQI